jgi:NAD(P)-dependent dehydrogenase (short-subunit alcohol dehydrogenase family)
MAEKEDWNRVVAVDLTGVFLCMQGGVKLMLPQECVSIINIAFVPGLVGTGPDIPATSQCGVGCIELQRFYKIL